MSVNPIIVNLILQDNPTKQQNVPLEICPAYDIANINTENCEAYIASTEQQYETVF